MPREAIKLGAVDDVIPIQHIPRAIVRFWHTQEKGTEKQLSETTRSSLDLHHRGDPK
jgi:hypothetical protein